MRHASGVSLPVPPRTLGPFSLRRLSLGFTSGPLEKPLMRNLGGEKQHIMFTWKDIEWWTLGGTLLGPLWPPYSSLVAASVG